MHWFEVFKVKTPKNIPILTKVQEGNISKKETILVLKSNNIWFNYDMTTYINYTSTHWSRISNDF